MADGTVNTISNPISELDRLRGLGRELVERLQSHGRTLALRTDINMNLPVGSLESLEQVVNKLGEISGRFDNWSVELAQKQMQTIHFMKNLCIMGGMLYIMAFGAGPFSVDNRKS